MLTAPKQQFTLGFLLDELVKLDQRCEDAIAKHNANLTEFLARINKERKVEVVQPLDLLTCFDIQKTSNHEELIRKLNFYKLTLNGPLVAVRFDLKRLLTCLFEISVKRSERELLESILNKQNFHDLKLETKLEETTKATSHKKVKAERESAESSLGRSQLCLGREPGKRVRSELEKKTSEYKVNHKEIDIRRSDVILKIEELIIYARIAACCEGRTDYLAKLESTSKLIAEMTFPQRIDETVTEALNVYELLAVQKRYGEALDKIFDKLKEIQAQLKIERFIYEVYERKVTGKYFLDQLPVYEVAMQELASILASVEKKVLDERRSASGAFEHAFEGLTDDFAKKLTLHREASAELVFEEDEDVADKNIAPSQALPQFQLFRSSSESLLPERIEGAEDTPELIVVAKPDDAIMHQRMVKK